MIDSCSIEKKGLISIDQALEKIRLSISPIDNEERVTLKHALGRILSAPVYSPVNIPPVDNSAMDGYAFNSVDIKPNQHFSLSLVGTSWAGEPYNKILNPGECVRIFTGGVIPQGADSIVMQEHITKLNNEIIFSETTQAGQYIRETGCDIKKNTPLISYQKKISAVDMGLLASAGIYDISVKCKLNIAYFSTGNELSPIGHALDLGQIYDSNRYTLAGLLNDLNHNISDLGAIPDDKNLIESTLLMASKTFDVIISTGGASVGDADYIKEILDKCADVGFWKIAIKPGKPLAFGKINNCCFFGLPGNPVSVITTFHKIVSPALHQLSGMTDKPAFSIKAICTSQLKKEKGRQEYQRGILTQNESAEFFVESAGKQGSNIMSAMSRANCYIVLPIESDGVSIGESVLVEAFNHLGNL